MPKAADGAGARHLKVGLGFTENRWFLALLPPSKFLLFPYTFATTHQPLMCHRLRPLDPLARKLMFCCSCCVVFDFLVILILATFQEFPIPKYKYHRAPACRTVK